jgi:hypothetical protein
LLHTHTRKDALPLKQSRMPSINATGAAGSKATIVHVFLNDDRCS